MNTIRKSKWHCCHIISKHLVLAAIAVTACTVAVAVTVLKKNK